MTKKYKLIKNCLGLLSLILTCFPIIFYTVRAFVEGTSFQKVSLGLLTTAAIILTLVNILFKMHLRSTMWLALIGISTCLQNITTLLIIIAVTTILDELIITPLRKKYKNLYIINREIDKR